MYRPKRRNTDVEEILDSSSACCGGIFVYFPTRVAASSFEASSAATLQPVVRSYGRLRFEPCTLSARGAGHIRVLCAQLPILENPALPEGRRITLKIAWLERDSGSHPASDPVFSLLEVRANQQLESLLRWHLV